MKADQDQKFEALLDFLKRGRGFDFTGYKRSSLERRVCKRMQAVGVEDYVDYIDYLEVHPDEFAALFNAIQINVTAFFRDEGVWECMSQVVIPQILAAKKDTEPIRVWSAGCASGEEAYTLVILLNEALGSEAFKQRVKVYATDVDEEALNLARQGSYSGKAVEAIPPALRDKYFVVIDGHYVFQADLRRSIIFGRHDLMQDAPISRLDLLVCRNTLMYFNVEAQDRILARFHFALNEGGFLFLGKAEMMVTHSNLFSPVELKGRIFKKLSHPNGRANARAMAQANGAMAHNRVEQQARLRQAAFGAGPVAQIVVGRDGNLALANERACALLNLRPGDLGRPLQDLELSYRPAELRSMIEQAYAERRPIKLFGVEKHSAEGTQILDIQTTPLADGDDLLGVAIAFEDVTQRRKLETDLQHSAHELETSYEELQSAHEELETTSEELQSTNEELETTNEELQSTNEELETMNEELQSTNEELEAINEELRRRTGECNNINSFLQSILTSLRSGVCVVDRQLQVMVWNHRAEDLWGLRADEVRGQPILDLDIGLPVEQLPLAPFLAGKASFEEMTLPAINRRGKVVDCHVTCTPFLGLDGERLGVVLMMEEVVK